MTILALDFGGTKHTAGVIEQGRKHWEAREQVYSPASATAQYDLETILSLSRRLLGGVRPSAIGVSFGGPVTASTGRIRLSHHVPGWEDMPLGQILEDELGAPAWVDNDANVAALGELRYGTGIGFISLMYITVSTGVGGGLILDGKVWRGANSMAGEIGHTVVDPKGSPCLCGKNGCLERLASGRYMAQDARQHLYENVQEESILRELSGMNPDVIDGSLISQAAALGDRLASELLKRSAWALGVGIGNAANLINPQRFVLGGGVTKSGEGWWKVVQETARKTALPEVQFDIMPAALGDDAPLWGAAALALEGLSL